MRLGAVNLFTLTFCIHVLIHLYIHSLLVLDKIVIVLT